MVNIGIHSIQTSKHYLQVCFNLYLTTLDSLKYFIMCEVQFSQSEFSTGFFFFLLKFDCWVHLTTRAASCTTWQRGPVCILWRLFGERIKLLSLWENFKCLRPNSPKNTWHSSESAPNNATVFTDGVGEWNAPRVEGTLTEICWDALWGSYAKHSFYPNTSVLKAERFSAAGEVDGMAWNSSFCSADALIQHIGSAVSLVNHICENANVGAHLTDRFLPSHQVGFRRRLYTSFSTPFCPKVNYFASAAMAASELNHTFSSGAANKSQRALASISVMIFQLQY